jgi:hypothetical protein
MGEAADDELQLRRLTKREKKLLFNTLPRTRYGGEDLDRGALGR